MSLSDESFVVNGNTVHVSTDRLYHVTAGPDVQSPVTAGSVTAGSVTASPDVQSTVTEQTPSAPYTKPKVVPRDNILSDHNELLEQLEEIKSSISDDPIPPAVFAREPSAADSYISLINAWKDAENANVINITPTSVKSVSQVAGSLTVGDQWVQQSYTESRVGTRGVGTRGVGAHSVSTHSGSTRGVSTAYATHVMYESDDDTQGGNELEDKIDATYNKLCSLEIANADALDAVNQVNGQLENIGRNSFATSKQLPLTDYKVDRLAIQVEKLSEQFTGMMSEIQCIKNLLVSAERRGNCFVRNFE
jgi:hypothetical protein